MKARRRWAIRRERGKIIRNHNPYMKKVVFGKTSVILLLLAVTLPFTACKKRDTQQVPTSKVSKGTFYIDLYEEGEVEAVRSTIISSPLIPWRYFSGQLKISQIVKNGDEVQAGDTLIIFDPSDVEKSILDYEGRLEIGLAELDQLIAQQQSQMEEMKADLEIAEISHEISQINAEQAEYESQVRKEEIKITLEKADIALQKAKEQVENQRKIQEEDLRQKKMSVDQLRSYLEQAHSALKDLFVMSPTPGIAIIRNNWSTGSQYQVGDQIWTGAPMIELPDLSQLKATVKINEVDIGKISKGLEVEIRPDAFSETVIPGKVTSVANLAVDKDNNNKAKVFPVEVTIEETHKNLAPGMTVSCRILMDKIDDVLYIPIEALHTEGLAEYVYKKRGGNYERVDVVTGQKNNDYVIITEGLSERDEIALIDPFAATESNEETPQEG